MSEPGERKILVDEDWKSQVIREREELRQRLEDSPAKPSSAADQADEAAVQAEASSASDFPPASLELLISTLASQALAALGFLPDESGKTLPPQKAIAKHFIDTLAILEEKTQGNLTAIESALLSQVLHELRMSFVSVKGE